MRPYILYAALLLTQALASSACEAVELDNASLAKPDMEAKPAVAIDEEATKVPAEMAVDPRIYGGVLNPIIPTATAKESSPPAKVQMSDVITASVPFPATAKVDNVSPETQASNARVNADFLREEKSMSSGTAALIICLFTLLVGAFLLWKLMQRLSRSRAAKIARGAYILAERKVGMLVKVAENAANDTDRNQQ